MLLFDLVPFSEMLAFGLGLASIGAALLIQCSGSKRAPPKKVQRSKSVRSAKSDKSKKSSRSQRAKTAGPVKSKRSSRSSQKKVSLFTHLLIHFQLRSASRSASKKSSKSGKARIKKLSSTTAVPLPMKKTSEKSAKRPVALQEVTARSKREKDPSLKSLQETQQSVSHKHQLQVEAAQAGQLPELQMEPRVLRFNKQGGLLKVQLHNPSSVRQAIKVKCSDNNLYRVNPVFAYVEPGQQLNVYVMRQNSSSKLDKIVFVTAKASDANTDLKQLFKESAYGHNQQAMMVLPLWA